MTQEEKEILIQDICARLPYGMKVNIKAKRKSYIATVCEITRNYICVEGGGEICFSHGAYKPYLRPMSSMTEEEDKEFQEIKLSYHFDEDSYILLDWLNKKIFDYRGLIPMGLALPAKEGMYE